MTTTEKLLNDLNHTKGLKYPDIGYSYYADIKGDGQNNRKVYTIINENGGVTRSCTLNAKSARKRCDNIRHFTLMARFPIMQDGGFDYRYRICRQFTGREGEAFVALFCDEWIEPKSYDTYKEALSVLMNHHAKREGAA